MAYITFFTTLKVCFFNQDLDAHDKIKELRRIAFDSDGSGATDGGTRRSHGGFAKDYKKLGFKCDINPALDFTETPPGMLALDCMIYFARSHTEGYTKVRLSTIRRGSTKNLSIRASSVWNIG